MAKVCWIILALTQILVSSALVDAQENVAVGKPTVHSSEGWGGNPGRAVDGDVSNVYGQGSCTHTEMEDNPFWAIDLQGVYDIDSVRIYNREDCCGDRLRQVIVYTTDSMPTRDSPPSQVALCGNFAGPSTNGAVEEITCEGGLQGRFLVVQLQAREYLTLCEVQIFGTLIDEDIFALSGENVAAGKPTEHSSEGWSGNPGRAVDGDVSNVYGQGSCTHTQMEDNPWWAIDLQEEYDIEGVRIYNREDCCGDRLREVIVYTTDVMPTRDSPPSQVAVCGNFAGPSYNGAIEEITCEGGLQGRYLVVQLQTREYLTLCEVQVFGSLAERAVECPDTSALDAQIIELETQLAQRQEELGSEISALQQQVDDTAALLSDSADTKAALEAEKAAIQDQLNQIQGQLDDSIVAQALSDEANAALESGMAAIQAALDESTSSQLELEGQKGQLQSQVEQFQALLQESEATLESLQAENNQLQGELGTAQVSLDASIQANTAIETENAGLQTQLADNQVQLDSSVSTQEQLQAENIDLANQIAELQAELESCAAAPELPTAVESAPMSDTASEFTLDNGVRYILEASTYTVNTDANAYCAQHNMKLASIENPETLEALRVQLAAIATEDVTEVAVGERVQGKRDRDVAFENFNAAGGNCVTFVPGDDGLFKTIGGRCNVARSVLCAATPANC